MISLLEIALGLLLFVICGTVFLVSGLAHGGLLTTGNANDKHSNQPIKTEKESKL